MRRFRRLDKHEMIGPGDEVIFGGARRHPEVKGGYQCRRSEMGSDHVGYHHQFILSRVLQEIPDRHAKAWLEYGINLRKGAFDISQMPEENK